jgi:putative oxidoreductase
MFFKINQPLGEYDGFKVKSIFVNISCALLILLWTYTAFSKLADLTEFKRQLGNQVFGKSGTLFLLWFIPISEISAALLLLFRKTRLIGLALSHLLMIVFTTYIALILTGYYDRVPCSCGGVLKQMGWTLHFFFNLFFLLLSLIAFFFEGQRKWWYLLRDQ